MSGRTATLGQVAEENAALVVSAYDKVLNQHDTKALEAMFAEDYLQHNPHVVDGRGGLAMFVEFRRTRPEVHNEIKRVIAQGDLVTLHVQATDTAAQRGDGYAGTAIVDISTSRWRDPGDFVPRYPGPLPAGVRPGLIVSLRKCSIAQVHDVFMNIEEPDESVGSHRDHDHTIGDFYHQILDAFVRLSAKGDLFCGDPARQLGPANWHGPGTLYAVTDLNSALLAIREIVHQGEGASAKDPDDGDHELAHFYRFEEIVKGRRMVRVEGRWEFTGAPVPFDAENPNYGPNAGPSFQLER